MVKFCVVGSGLAGCSMARLLAEKYQEKVLVLEKRNHIGGNAYDCYNEEGILIHQYGPHIYHTNHEDVHTFLSRFTDWIDYEHRVLSKVGEKYVPMPISIETINALYDVNYDEAQFEAYLNKVKLPIAEIQTSEDVVLSQAGVDIYEKLFKGYTTKQWGVSPAELDSSVISRIPFRKNYDTRYFSDTYQGMPKEGYTKMMAQMLDHPCIEVRLNTDFQKVKNDLHYETLIYTGPIDEYFDYAYGKLLYRSLRFSFETYPIESYQSVAVVNYPNDEDFTRISEFKKMTMQDHPYTTIVKEYPCFSDEPFYPYPTLQNKVNFEPYAQAMRNEENVIFIGRLAEYRYYNMDAVVKRALELVESL